MPKRKIILYNQKLRQSARELRKNMTDAERKLWKHIRRKQIEGLQFYRQRPVGNYIVDFYCPDAGVVIEVDGGQHYTGKENEADKKRDDFMNSVGLDVLRFSNIEVLQNIEGVVDHILEYLKKKR